MATSDGVIDEIWRCVWKETPDLHVLGSELRLISVVGDGQEPHRVYMFIDTHYKDSLLKVGWPFPQKRTFFCLVRTSKGPFSWFLFEVTLTSDPWLLPWEMLTHISSIILKTPWNEELCWKLVVWRWFISFWASGLFSGAELLVAVCFFAYLLGIVCDRYIVLLFLGFVCSEVICPCFLPWDSIPVGEFFFAHRSSQVEIVFFWWFCDPVILGH